MTRPRRWARGLVRVATDLLPPGPVRDRYRTELEAELWGQGRARQLRTAVSILLGAPALHRSLVETGVLDVPHSPLWCRARLHHRWRRVTTEDNHAFRRCRDCGLDDDETYLVPRSDVVGVALRGPAM